jgi:integrase
MAAATNVIPLALPAQAIPRKTNRSTMTYLSCEEVLSVLKAARARSVRDWAMVLVAYRHGLRASEVCGLKLSDVNPKDQTIRVARLKGSMLTTQPMLPHRGRRYSTNWRRSGPGLRYGPPMAPIFCSHHRKAVGSTARNSSACSGPLPNLPTYRARSDTPTF